MNGLLKRFVCILCVFAMCLLPLVGCAERQYKETSEDMKTIRMLGIDLFAKDQSGKTVFLSDWINDPECKMWQTIVHDLEERGIHLEVDLLPREQYFSFLQTKILSDLEDYDWVFLGDMVDQETRVYLIENGIVAPINEIWTNYSDGTADKFYRKGEGTLLGKMRTYDDGNVYYLGNASFSNYDGLKASNSYVINIRYDWLKTLGLDIPKTTEELYDTLLAFQQKDVNNSGVKDEIINTNLLSFENGFAQAFGLGHELVFFDPKSGKMTSPFYQETVKDYFAYMNKLYEAGLLDVTFEDSSEIEENLLGVISHRFLSIGEENDTILGQDDYQAKWIPIMPVAEGIDRYVCALDWKTTPMEYFGVTSYADKEAVGILLDYISTVEFDTLSFYGIEEYSFEMVNGHPVKYQNPQQSDAQIMSNGVALWSYLLPSIQRVDYKAELSGMVNHPERVEACNQYYLNLEDYDVVYSPETMIAEPTREESLQIANMIADLETYQNDLMLKLITGKKSLDDWDTYIKDLRSLGLDTLIGFYQAEFEQYLEDY